MSENHGPTAQQTALARERRLPDAEVQYLADLALKAWENGAPVEVFDSRANHWTFLQVREPAAMLEVSYVDPNGETHLTRVSGREFGVADVRPKLASVVLALVCPA